MQRIKYSDQHLICLKEVREMMTREDLDDSHIILKEAAIGIQEQIMEALLCAMDGSEAGNGYYNIKERLRKAPVDLLDTLYAMQLGEEKTDLYEDLIWRFFRNLTDCFAIGEDTRRYFWEKARARRYFKCSIETLRTPNG